MSVFTCIRLINTDIQVQPWALGSVDVFHGGRVKKFNPPVELKKGGSNLCSMQHSQRGAGGTLGDFLLLDISIRLRESAVDKTQRRPHRNS